MNSTKNTNWRVLLVVLVLAALGLLAAAALLDWNPLAAARAGARWPRGQFSGAHFQSPPALVALVGAFFTLFTSGLILMFLLPERLAVMARSFERPAGAVLRMTLLGLLAGLLVSVAALSASLTMTTFVLTIILSMGLILSAAMGMVALTYHLGRFFLRRAGWMVSPVLALLIGNILVFSFINIPVLGAAALLVIAGIGLGTAIETRFGTNRPWSLISLTEEGKE